MAQRGRNTQYPDHQIQDRELQEFTTRYTNEDGESVVVDADNPLPIVDTNDAIIKESTQTCLLQEILIELKKLNKTGDELMDGEVL